MRGHKDGNEIYELAHEGDSDKRDTPAKRTMYTTNRYAPPGSRYIIQTDDGDA